jgi:hypothetical protein
MADAYIVCKLDICYLTWPCTFVFLICLAILAFICQCAEIRLQSLSRAKEEQKIWEFRIQSPVKRKYDLVEDRQIVPKQWRRYWSLNQRYTWFKPRYTIKLVHYLDETATMYFTDNRRIYQLLEPNEEYVLRRCTFWPRTFVQIMEIEEANDNDRTMILLRYFPRELANVVMAF